MTDKSRGWADDDPRRGIDEAADQDAPTSKRVANSGEGEATDEEWTERAADENARQVSSAKPPTSPAADRYVMPEDEAVDDYPDAQAEEDTTGIDADPLSEQDARDLDSGTLGPTSDDSTAAPAGASADTRAGPHRGMGHIAEHDTDHWWRSWLGRTTAVLAGVLAVAAGLAWAWIGGMHAPSARAIPVAVVNGDAGANALMAAIGQNSNTLKTVPYDSPRAATDALTNRRVDAILTSDATAAGGGFNLSVASGAGPGVAETVATATASAAGDVSIPLTVEDLHPTSESDLRGLTPFSLMMAWILGGLLAAIALGVAIGTVPRDLDRFGMRLGALAVFSLLLGLLGALFAGPLLDVWRQHTFGLWMIGALITFAAALVTSALQSWLGSWGVGIAAVLLLVLGVPGSGGLVTQDFLPGFFRGMPTWLPTGLGTDLIRGLEYFGRSANTWPITGLTLWSLGAVLALLGATAVLGRRAQPGAGRR